MRPRILILLLCVWSSTTAAADKNMPWREAGIASVYSGNYSGKRAASGSTHRPSESTAAHRSLPFGTQVLVTNRRNDHSVIVLINDRGPYIAGRVIDLSPTAARALGFSGLAPVTLAIVSKDRRFWP